MIERKISLTEMFAEFEIWELAGKLAECVESVVEKHVLANLFAKDKVGGE